MNFGEALQALKEGSKVTREVWSGYWYISHNVEFSAGTGNGFQDGGHFKEIILAVLKDGKGTVPAQPYQEDLLAEDWQILD